jgi:membrane protein implicated in regulation of membrane protease activity
MTYSVPDIALGAALIIAVQIAAGVYLLWFGLSGRASCDEGEGR